MSAGLWFAAFAAAAQSPEALPPICAGPAFVYFDSGSAAITAEASARLQLLAASLTHDGGTHPVILRGHADRVGTEAANLLLSRRRAETVRDYLLAHGILPSRIVVTAVGETRPLVETDDDVPEQQNRIVVFEEHIPLAEMERRDAIWRRSGQPRPIC